MPLKRPLNGTLQPPAKRHRRMASEVHTAEDLNLKKDATCALNGQVVAWLECQASSQPEHGIILLESRGKKNQNAEIVQKWRFVRTFMYQYVGKFFDIPVRIATC